MKHYTNKRYYCFDEKLGLIFGNSDWFLKTYIAGLFKYIKTKHMISIIDLKKRRMKWEFGGIGE